MNGYLYPEFPRFPWGAIAQRLEQRTHNPSVPGSNPGCPTLYYSVPVHVAACIKNFSFIPTQNCWEFVGSNRPVQLMQKFLQKISKSQQLHLVSQQIPQQLIFFNPHTSCIHQPKADFFKNNQRIDYPLIVVNFPILYDSSSCLAEVVRFPVGAYIREYKKKAGQKSYTVYYDKVINGERIRKHKTCLTKAEAKEWVAEVEYELKKGIITKDTLRKRLLRDVIQDYEKAALPHLRNARNVRQHLHWWNHHLGKFELAAILPAHIAEGKDKLLKEPGLRGFMLKPATIHRYLASLSGLFEWLLKEKHWIQENPVKKVRWPKVNNARARFLTEKEISNLLSACDQSRNERLGTYVRIALLTGMRKGELLNLCWKDVDFERKQIMLEDTKNGDSRSIPMVGELKNILHNLVNQELCSVDMLLFPGVEDPSKSRDFQTAWKRALRLADIKGFTFHDLRHCAATIMLEAGVPHFAVARVLGHRLLNTTLRYSHLTEQAAREALEHISKKVEGLK